MQCSGCKVAVFECNKCITSLKLYICRILAAFRLSYTLHLAYQLLQIQQNSLVTDQKTTSPVFGGVFLDKEEEINIGQPNLKFSREDFKSGCKARGRYIRSLYQREMPFQRKMCRWVGRDLVELSCCSLVVGR